MNRFPEAGTSNVLPNAHLQTACPPLPNAHGIQYWRKTATFSWSSVPGQNSRLSAAYGSPEGKNGFRAGPWKEYGSRQNCISQPEHLSYNKRGMPCSELFHGALLPYASLCFPRQ